MPQFSFEKTCSSDRNTVYKIFSDYENYQKTFPKFFPSIRIRSIRDNVAVVEEHLNLGDDELVIMAKHVTDEPVLHDVFVIGGDAKGSHIQEQFIETPHGTKILVNVDLKLKGKMKIGSMFSKNRYQQNYEEIIDNFIKIAEN
ncbi:polyketide cyclase [Candidatus Nitrosopumilus sp. SW]|uniref:SRPBCC family protein n=1 Tax=Candidatus Nitrosopumilus sp. SW TaxID=2508726 RepID=UPI00114F85AF|nr:SRPBCC family protein [Candidatus Nitrosopumilus sp. SW]QDI88191.1 polyketide cyclase [Candidatus Nitrosopumilus sp. SW]